MVCFYVDSYGRVFGLRLGVNPGRNARIIGSYEAERIAGRYAVNMIEFAVRTHGGRHRCYASD